MLSAVIFFIKCTSGHLVYASTRIKKLHSMKDPAKCTRWKGSVAGSQRCLIFELGLLLKILHALQFFVISSMSLSMPNHQQKFLLNSFILMQPKCPACNSFNTRFFKVFGTTILSFLKIIPSCKVNSLSR